MEEIKNSVRSFRDGVKSFGDWRGSVQDVWRQQEAARPPSDDSMARHPSTEHDGQQDDEQESERQDALNFGPSEDSGVYMGIESEHGTPSESEDDNPLGSVDLLAQARKAWESRHSVEQDSITDYGGERVCLNQLRQWFRQTDIEQASAIDQLHESVDETQEEEAGPVEDEQIEQAIAADQPSKTATRHVAKAKKTARGREATLTDEPDQGQRKSGRAATVKKSAEVQAPKKAFLKPKQLPPKDFDLLKLSTPAGYLPTADLGKKRCNSLRDFWKSLATKDRVDTWFNGKADSCAYHQCIRKIVCPNEHGKDFACSGCIEQKKPCLRVVLDDEMRPHVVKVLPEFEEEDEEVAKAFGYFV